ncbi:MAG: RNA-binding transcriptional accessory protein [Bacteroidales bacterium]|nr:RNA-binding transcriptional accessory protein [Bacteroidales bacterium]
MTDSYIKYIAERLQLASWQVENTVELLEEGATIPFISRYRKERTGGIDETYVAQIKHYFVYLTDLDKRKQAIVKSIEQQDKMTPELAAEIEAAVDARVLEDIYLPYKPKRRTRASVAKEKGLEPLALKLYEVKTDDIYAAAAPFCNDYVPTKDDALAGASDIIAEWLSEDTAVRQELRDLYYKWGTIVSRVAKGKEDDEKTEKYQTYSNFSQRVDKIPPHRLLAILRGASEEVLTAKIEVNEDYAYERMERCAFRGKRKPSAQLRNFLSGAVGDAYKRLLHPSIENEVLAIAKEKADIESIKVFGENLRQLLLAPPVGQKRTLAIDPGFRTGCKVVCLDAEGKLLHNDTIYPHPPVSEKTLAMKKISQMVESYKIEVIAIGNGTAGRETEYFIKKIALPEGVRVYSVSEDGASVYSASDVAREEFPDYDVTVRGAVSIGRRLMDPLAELVKIDPKSIGVGQYQHDVNQTLLKETLDNTVESCVNSVGVNLNTASKHLLSYVSGIGPALAQNIVDYRSENGAFLSRQDLLKVKRLGDKAFEQCAGFLRITGAANPLDNSAVHPERYGLVERIAADMGVEVSQLISNEQLCAKIDVNRYVSDVVGLLTLNDIVKELSKPGRDPRKIIKVFEFSDEIKTIEDLRVGMELPAIVTNITDFGAFVDIGIKQNGLIHVSKMSNRRISSPSEVLKIHQHIHVKVEGVDLNRQRISLSLVIEGK